MLIGSKSVGKKPKGEPKSISKNPPKDVAMVEAREVTKKEKTKITSVRRKDAPKKSVRRSKLMADNMHEVPTPSLRKKKYTSPAASEDKLVDKKKDETSKKEIKIIAKTPRNIDKEQAQKFFKQKMENQTTWRRSREEDMHMETMPESSQISGMSKKSRKGRRSKSKKTPLDRNIFKENGEPVWVVPDRKPSEWVMNEDGELIKYPELAAALEEDELEMEDGKGWFDKITALLSGELKKGKSDSKQAVQEIKAFDSMETLKERTELLFSKDVVIYNTCESTLHLSHNAIERFTQQNDDTCPRKSVPPFKDQESKFKKRPREEEKTCVVTSIHFNSIRSIITYDRRHPIASIQKLKKKHRDQLKVLEDQKEVKESGKEKENEEAPTQARETKKHQD
ncbi:hypothetical protein GCK72_005867 [Caenorhabditis remanei]|uniref:Uncharacterized protein n=1 Tax=Caenorhabditis remanei TaxID=31234 RepID=A0A6A5HGQ2_CAERE|nr:hypothetical protein GCK72_005867 [Caenorhabditis remanei]KAF1765914.1 hypothetical protein GCK72_005867 [Caenorhabditis remanei]